MFHVLGFIDGPLKLGTLSVSSWEGFSKENAMCAMSFKEEIGLSAFQFGVVK